MRPDQVSLGVLVNAVPRDAVDDAVAVCGVREKRSDGKLPAHVITYLTLALCLFPDDDYTEVATKVTGSLDRWGCWNAAWRVPTASGDHPGPQTAGPPRVRRVVRTHLRPGRRAGRPDRRGGGVGHRAGVVPAPVAAAGDRRVRDRRARQQGERRRVRLRRVRGQPLGVPQGPGGGVGRVRHPRLRGRRGRRLLRRGEDPGARLYPRLRADELLTADRGFYSWQAWDSRRGDRGGAAVAGPDPARPAGRAGARRRDLPHRADQAHDPRAPPGAAAGRRPRRARI